MQGKIVKGVAGFYYVHTMQEEIYECKAKGIFRKEKIKPLVGDDVEIDILNQEEKKGNIIAILPRRNELLRPAVANIDQALVIFAAISPKPNFNLLDKFLIIMESQQVNTAICFNKQDLTTVKELKKLYGAYESCGYEILFTSAKQKQGINSLQQFLDGKTTAVAGPSGVGKSSLINLLQAEVEMEIGALSEKIERGKNTTRHTQLIHVKNNTYIMDTPGFSSLRITDLEKEDLKKYFKEFLNYEESCRFLGCSHIQEPDCGVKQALLNGKISEIRYENYVSMYNELNERKRY